VNQSVLASEHAKYVANNATVHPVARDINCHTVHVTCVTRASLASFGQLRLETPLDSCEQVLRAHIFLFVYGALDLANLVLNFQGQGAISTESWSGCLMTCELPQGFSSSAQANTTMTFFISKDLSMPQTWSAVSVRPERPRQRRGWTVVLLLGGVART
jgi:hypothetical protein